MRKHFSPFYYMELIVSVFWSNPKYEPFQTEVKKIPLNEKYVKDAEERLKRFAPYIAKVFPETRNLNGIIESPIVPIPAMHQQLSHMYKPIRRGFY
ncbi:hypothetical protein C8K15_11319 [Paenisporosarcina sp. OV554]|nr:hypothetical protein C8K15_11319 [Paenisporosarcina sp. OV554]